MSAAPGTIVASRYQLVERLGTGAMGEVWRAQDTRFESRVVALKLLREDTTLEEDALSRDRLAGRIERLVARGDLTLPRILEAFSAVLTPGTRVAALHAQVTQRLGSTGPYDPPAIGRVFDELVNDPDFNENAKLRAKLRRFFKDEANSVATLRHDNIVSIFDYGEHERNPYLVMDFIEGRTLFQMIEDREPLSRTRRLRLMEDLCAGLAYAHRQKLVHRDIKPANLIIDGGTDRLKILDFGVVRRIGTEATVGVAVGTFSYMSPEQSMGASTLDHRSDIFSVGLVFYELLSGRKAFPPGRSVAELMRQIQQDPPAPLADIVPDLQPEIGAIVNRALEKDPARRYQDLAAMERDISRVRARLEIAEHADRVDLATADTIILAPPGAEPALRQSPGHTAAPASPSPPPVAPPDVAPDTFADAPLEGSSASQGTTPAIAFVPIPPPAQMKPGLGLPLRLDAKLVPLVAVGALLIAAAVTLWALGSRITPDDAPPQSTASVPPASPTTNESPSGPAPSDASAAASADGVAGGALTEVTIDVRPWARVLVVPAASDVQVPTEPLYTPFTLDLPPGDYTLNCENGGVTPPGKITMTVAAGPRQFFTRNMPGFNATRVTDALLGQDD